MVFSHVPAEYWRFLQLHVPDAPDVRRNAGNKHIIEYVSVLRRKEIQTRAMTWVKLEDLIQSEVSQLQKDKYSRNPLICIT